MSEDEFYDKSRSLIDLLLTEGAWLCDRIDFFPRANDEDSAYYGYLKGFLVDDGALCDEIFKGIKGRLTLLSLSAARVILEDVINVEYVATRPSEADRKRIALDWIARGNDRKLHKNELDNETVFKRAKLAGKDAQAIYENEYADLCNYVHGTAYRVWLNASAAHADLAGKKAIFSAILAYFNIVTRIGYLTGLSASHYESLARKAQDFLDEYDQSVAKASIDIPSDVYER